MKETLVFVFLILGLLHTISAQDDVTVTSGPINNQKEPDAAVVFQYILDTVKRTNDGINATDLQKAAEFVKSQASRLAPEIAAEDVDKVILEAAAKVNLVVEAKALLSDKERDPDALKSDVLKIDDALKLWEALATIGNSAEDEKKSVALAAAGQIADKILTILPTLVSDVVQYSKENNIKGTAEVPASIVFRRYSEENPTPRNKRDAPSV